MGGGGSHNLHGIGCLLFNFHRSAVKCDTTLFLGHQKAAHRPPGRGVNYATHRLKILQQPQGYAPASSAIMFTSG